MPFIATNFNVGTVAVVVAPADANPQQVLIHNNSEHIIYIGGSNITSTTGLNILKQQTEEIYLVPGDALYAIAEGENRDVRVLRTIK